VAGFGGAQGLEEGIGHGQTRRASASAAPV
jgi:hypothetical protein